MNQRLLVITPVHNEAAQIARVAAAMRRQTRQPDRWIVIDDGSTDGTPAILERLVEEVNFMEIRRLRPGRLHSPRPERALAPEARAFNQALDLANLERFTHVAKLDGDVELPSGYFRDLLSEFCHDPRLGVAGGVLSEPTRDGWKIRLGDSDHHIGGALKCYSTECLEAIGGIHERLAWDTIDETSARMLGFRTRGFGQIVAVRQRRPGTADVTLTDRAREGRGDYMVGYPFWWVLLVAARLAGERPRGLAGVAFLTGYLRAAGARDSRVQDPAFRSWVRHELAARTARAAGLPKLAARLAPAGSLPVPGPARLT
jgi:biofilm PGA synthesis N-glycosyltransferase PgaC